MAAHSFTLVPAAYVYLLRPAPGSPRDRDGAVSASTQVLLQLRRNTGYMDGHWACGASGHVEAAESVVETALRETREESGARAEVDGPLFAILDVPHAEQVHAFYRARLLSPELDPGEESLDARLFDEKDIPWDEIAFSTVETTLRWFLADRRLGRFSLHEGHIPAPSGRQPTNPSPRQSGNADTSSDKGGHG